MLDRLRAWLGLERRALELTRPGAPRLYGGATGTSSGEPVSLERAAGLPAVWACVT